MVIGLSTGRASKTNIGRKIKIALYLFIHIEYIVDDNLNTRGLYHDFYGMPACLFQFMYTAPSFGRCNGSIEGEGACIQGACIAGSGALLVTAVAGAGAGGGAVSAVAALACLVQALLHLLQVCIWITNH